ncbi:MAG: hypothetical protein QXP36_09405 [Conexivisphaerales archaeon]
MFKPNNKKMLTVVVAVAMVFSALAILSFAAQPAFAASGTITSDYSTLYVGLNNYVLISGGTFASGAPLYYEFSKTNAWSGTGNDWFSLTPGDTTLTNAGIVLNPSSAGSYYLLISDSPTASSGVISLKFTAITPPIYPSEFQVSPAVNPETVSLPGQTSNAPATTTIYGIDIPSTDSVTVYMLSGWTPASPYSFPSIGTAEENSIIATVSFTGAQLDAPTGQAFTMPTTVPGGDYAFIAIDTTLGTPVLSDNFLDTSDYWTISGWTAYSVISVSSFTPFSIGFSSFSTQPPISTLQLFTVDPSVVYSVDSLSGSSSEVFSFTGYGFIAGDTFTPSIATVTIGGTQVIWSGTINVLSNGQVSFSGVHLSVSSTSWGFNTLVMTDDQHLLYPSLNGIYISTPSINYGQFFLTDLKSGDGYGYVGDPFMAIVYNYPASTAVTVTIDNLTLASGPTDSNGYALFTGFIPALPGSSNGKLYTVYAMAGTGETGLGGFYKFYLYSYNTGPLARYHPIYNLTSGSYVPSGAMVQISDFGVDPLNTYILEGAIGTSVSVSVGTQIATDEFASAANGTLILSFETYYAPTISTGTQETASLVAVSSSGTTVYTLTLSMYAVGPVTDTGFPDTAQFVTSSPPGGTILVPTFYGLIPSSATLFYPTVSNVYSLYVAPALTPASATLITFSSGNNYLTSSNSGLAFSAPSATGVYNVYIDYYGTKASSAASSALDYFVFVVSSPSGTPAIFMNPTNNVVVAGESYTYFIAFNLPALDFTEALVVNGNGLPSYVNVGTDFNGVISINYGYITGVPSGKYQAYVVANYFVPENTAVASLSFTVRPGTDTILSPVTLFTPVGKLDFYGLAANTLYNVNFKGFTVASGYSSSGGALTPIIGTLASYGIYVPAGSYNFTIAPASSPSAVIAAATIPVTVLQNPDLSLSTMSQYAFPGQIVQFSAEGLEAPTLITSSGSVYDYPVGYEANILLNGTLFQTVPASFQTSSSGVTYLNGSFEMPNNAIGSYYNLTITGLVEYSNYVGGSVLGGSGSNLLTTGTAPMLGSQSDFLGLVQGKGALITGITPSQIAVIEFDINSTVTKSLSVPIADLNAAITSINGAVAYLKTTVGNITVALSTINATVLSISNGVALLKTDFGNVKTSLASLNASIVSLNDKVVTINTTLGTIITSLSAINATVSSIAKGQMTINTTLGKITTSLSSLNASIVALSG